MILDWSKVKIFVKPGPTDMRKQINGLSIIVTEELEKLYRSDKLTHLCSDKLSRWFTPESLNS